jgi:hypothetical protein
MPQTQSKHADAEDAQKSSGVSGVLVVAVMIAAFVGVFAFAKMTASNREGATEVPLGTIMVEVNAFDLPTRKKIVALEKAIAETGLDEFGPGSPSAKFLLPPDPAPGVPIARPLDTLTEDEWAIAWRYMALGQWHIPRLFRLDGTACVIRFGPKGRGAQLSTRARPGSEATPSATRSTSRSASSRRGSSSRSSRRRTRSLPAS